MKKTIITATVQLINNNCISLKFHAAAELTARQVFNQFLIESREHGFVEIEPNNFVPHSFIHRISLIEQDV